MDFPQFWRLARPRSKHLAAGSSHVGRGRKLEVILLTLLCFVSFCDLFVFSTSWPLKQGLGRVRQVLCLTGASTDLTCIFKTASLSVAQVRLACVILLPRCPEERGSEPDTVCMRGVRPTGSCASAGTFRAAMVGLGELSPSAHPRLNGLTCWFL